jgi:hypothetical protein
LAIALLSSIACAPLMISQDPAPSMARSQTWSRNLECERVSAEAGSERYPGRIVASAPRGDFIERDAVICRERLTRPGLRAPRDEAILSTLEDEATDLTTAAQSRRPDLAGRTWLVEAFYPSAPVAAKVSFATKAALMRRGLRVSDRAPTLGAGDVDVITRMVPDEAYPAACRRYFATGSLREGDALLAVVSRDPRETILHAGLCDRGQWTWLK